VSLATAFEMILTDNYSGGATRRLKRRLHLVLRAFEGRVAFETAFAELYAARGDLVHAGTDATGLDLHLAQQAFVHGFCVATSRIAQLSTRDTAPMRTLTRDASDGA
jgi:hypothetical protein